MLSVLGQDSRGPPVRGKAPQGRGGGFPSPWQARSHKSNPQLSGGGSGSLRLPPQTHKSTLPNGTQGATGLSGSKVCAPLHADSSQCGGPGWDAWVARAQGHRPQGNSQTQATWRPAGPASSLPSRLQAASHPPGGRRATGGPLGGAGDTLEARSLSANTGGLSGAVGFHQGKKQTRGEGVYSVTACADWRGTPGPPRPRSPPKRAVGLLLSAQSCGAGRGGGTSRPDLHQVVGRQGPGPRPCLAPSPCPGLPAARGDKRGFKTTTNKQTKKKTRCFYLPRCILVLRKRTFLFRFASLLKPQI